MGEIIEIKKSAVKEVLEAMLDIHEEIDSVIVIANLKNEGTRLGFTPFKITDICFASKLLDEFIAAEINRIYSESGNIE